VRQRHVGNINHYPPLGSLAALEMEGEEISRSQLLRLVNVNGWNLDKRKQTGLVFLQLSLDPILSGRDKWQHLKCITWSCNVLLIEFIYDDKNS
jgi:hypothetical protein